MGPKDYAQTETSRYTPLMEMGVMPPHGLGQSSQSLKSQSGPNVPYTQPRYQRSPATAHLPTLVTNFDVFSMTQDHANHGIETHAMQVYPARRSNDTNALPFMYDQRRFVSPYKISPQKVISFNNNNRTPAKTHSLISDSRSIGILPSPSPERSKGHWSASTDVTAVAPEEPNAIDQAAAEKKKFGLRFLDAIKAFFAAPKLDEDAYEHIACKLWD